MARAPSGLHQGPFPPAIPRGEASPPPFPGALFIARTHPRPRGQVLMARKGRHRASDFGQHHGRYTPIHARHGVQTLDLTRPWARLLLDLGIPFGHQFLLLRWWSVRWPSKAFSNSGILPRNLASSSSL